MLKLRGLSMRWRPTRLGRLMIIAQFFAGLWNVSFRLAYCRSHVTLGFFNILSAFFLRSRNIPSCFLSDFLDALSCLASLFSPNPDMPLVPLSADSLVLSADSSMLPTHSAVSSHTPSENREVPSRLTLQRYPNDPSQVAMHKRVLAFCGLPMTGFST